MTCHLKIKRMSEMNDKLFLQWIHDRMENTHGENFNVDYMHKLRCIIREMDDGKVTPATIIQDKPVAQPKQYKYEKVDVSTVGYCDIPNLFFKEFNCDFTPIGEIDAAKLIADKRNLYLRIELSPEEARKQEVEELASEFDEITTEHHGSVDLTMQEISINRVQARYILDNFTRKG